MTTTNLDSLIAAFDSLAKPIKDWVSSIQTSFLITDINRRLGLSGAKASVIPGLIFRLVTEDIEPLDFANELSHEMDISFQAAKSIAGEVESKILRPIETELKRDAGIDIKLIYFGQPGPRKSTSEETIQEAPSAQAPATDETPAQLEAFEAAKPINVTTETGKPLESITTKQPAPSIIPPLKTTEVPTAKIEEQPKKELEAQMPATPFMIHQEEATRTITPQRSRQNPVLNMEIGSSFRTQPVAPKPVAVRLETNEPAKPFPQKQTTVNYTETKTPAAPIEEKKPQPKSSEFINLDTFTKISGNTVDLRDDNK